jgi:hypothetical protein
MPDFQSFSLADVPVIFIFQLLCTQAIHEFPISFLVLPSDTLHAELH